MKQFDIEIDKTSPKVNQFTQTIGQNFSILVDYSGWTTNKATSNMEFFFGETTLSVLAAAE